MKKETVAAAAAAAVAAAATVEEFNVNILLKLTPASWIPEQPSHRKPSTAATSPLSLSESNCRLFNFPLNSPRLRRPLTLSTSTTNQHTGTLAVVHVGGGGGCGGCGARTYAR